jgi:hypothetical protein
MRTKILLLIFLNSLLLSIAAQQKGNTRIVVKNDSIKFNMVAKLLYFESYIIEQKDSTNGFIATKERALVKDASISVIYKFLIQPGSITITGEAANNVTINLTYAKSERTFVNISFAKGRMGRAWSEMDRLAHMFGTNISYW